jgi:hypothetical protein
MSDHEEKNCYRKILEQLTSLEFSLDKLNECITKLKQNHKEEETVEEEICPDEIEADKAAYDAIRDICIESLWDVEPKGEA